MKSSIFRNEEFMPPPEAGIYEYIDRHVNAKQNISKRVPILPDASHKQQQDSELKKVKIFIKIKRRKIGSDSNYVTDSDFES